MKKHTQYSVCCIPLILLFVIIPMVVKAKFLNNPLADTSWYYSAATISDFFLYYKSWLVTITGIIMLVFLFWQIGQMRHKNDLLCGDTKIFIPLFIYLVLAVLSSLFSEYSYFCTHGMPDQFETIWNLIAYVITACYCYYLIVYHDSEKPIMWMIYIGAGLVGVVCVLQFFKIDIYRLIYSGEGYSFTFAPGTVYGPFYNINYVGFYVLLLLPLFVLFTIFNKDLKARIISAILAVLMVISVIGAKSSTAIIALVAVGLFAVLFVLLKNAKSKKILWIPIAVIAVGAVCVSALAAPKVGAYIQASNTKKTALESIYTYDDHVEISYKGQKLNVSMIMYDSSSVNFHLTDQDQFEVSCTDAYTEDGYAYYNITDERFSGMTIMPILFSEEPAAYGFTMHIDDKDWSFTNQMTEDGAYYYYTDSGNLTKLTPEMKSEDFAPLESVSSLASGRGYIWNKTIALLKDYVLFGSGADTYALVFPNDDYVDLYNNGYAGLFLTKPHNLYLQIAVQTGVMSLLCFLVFYVWYFISSLRLYFKQRLDNPLVITGFAIMLGTLGYMISGLANDSTITVAPLYWALMGLGIGINHRIRMAAK